MAPPRQLEPKDLAEGSSRAKFYVGLIPWAPVSLEPPSDVTSDVSVRGNLAGSTLKP